MCGYTPIGAHHEIGAGERVFVFPISINLIPNDKSLGRGDAGKVLSQEYAAENGGVTLEMTPGGKWLDQMDLFKPDSPFSREQTLQIWSDVSTRMIREASGQVRSIIGTVNPSSIYREEQAELFINKNISGLDELNLKPRYKFGNY